MDYIKIRKYVNIATFHHFNLKKDDTHRMAVMDATWDSMTEEERENATEVLEVEITRLENRIASFTPSRETHE